MMVRQELADVLEVNGAGSQFFDLKSQTGTPTGIAPLAHLHSCMYELCTAGRQRADKEQIRNGPGSQQSASFVRGGRRLKWHGLQAQVQSTERTCKDVATTTCTNMSWKTTRAKTRPDVHHFHFKNSRLASAACERDT